MEPSTPHRVSSVRRCSLPMKRSPPAGREATMSSSVPTLLSPRSDARVCLLFPHTNIDSEHTQTKRPHTASSHSRAGQTELYYILFTDRGDRHIACYPRPWTASPSVSSSNTAQRRAKTRRRYGAALKSTGCVHTAMRCFEAAFEAGREVLVNDRKSGQAATALPRIGAFEVRVQVGTRTTNGGNILKARDAQVALPQAVIGADICSGPGDSVSSRRYNALCLA